MASRRAAIQGTSPLGFDDLSADAIASIEGDDFQDFCRELLDIELRDRHAADAELHGPRDGKDRGADLALRVKSSPVRSKEDYAREFGLALTEDTPGSTIFGCKTGDNLPYLLMRDARNGGLRVIEALVAGGRFTIIVNRRLDPDALYQPRRSARAGRGLPPAEEGGAAPRRSPLDPRGTRKKKAESDAPEARAERTRSLRELIAAELFAHVRREKPDAPDPSERIRFIDANDLQKYLRLRRPVELRASFREALGIPDIPGLDSFEQWRDYHRNERGGKRGDARFDPDQSRERSIIEIRGTSSRTSGESYDRILWLMGPPGVGKTRLAIEALGGDDRLRRRVLVASDVQRALLSLQDHRLLARFPSAILVVDDCPVIEVDRIVARFAADASPGNALLIITPHAREVALGSLEAGTARALNHVIHLEPMDAAAQRRLIAQEAGPAIDPARIEKVARLTEGYPWFAVLVARELRENPQARIETSAQAADYVLASRHEEATSRRPWEDLVLERARCLLVAMLTESTDWDGLSDAEKEGLCRAAGVTSWLRVVEVTRDCVRRGILRMRLGRTFKYVTPAILAREVALKLLRPPPDGPGCGPEIWRHARRFAPDFYGRLEQLDLDPASSRDVLGELAADVVEALRTGPLALDILGPNGVPTAALRFAARHRPGPLAAMLRALVTSTSLDDLRARRDARRDLVFALASLARRRAGFDDAEAALFHLALAENEHYANNATHVWAELFLIELNPTYRTFEERLPLLRERCTSGEAASRLAALSGLGAALSTHTYRLGDEQRDGPYATPTRAEARRARLDAWRLLVELAQDQDTALSSAARRMISGHLRNAVRAGMGAEIAGLVLPALSTFSERELVELRVSIQEIELQRQEAPDGPRDSAATWAALVRATAPSSYAERLRQAVGTWTLARRGEEGPRDEALAREGITQPDLLQGAFDWLESKEAVRSVAFVRALGRADENRVFLERLLVRARSGGPASADLLASYLRGFQEAGREAEVDGLLRHHLGDQRLADAIALTVHRLGATDERMRWVIAAVKAGRLSEGVIHGLAFGGWEKSASDATLEALAQALLDVGTRAALITALWLLVHRQKGCGSEVNRWRDLLHAALQGLADGELEGLTEGVWEQGAQELVKLGEVDSALALTLARMRARGPQSGSFGWQVLRACAEKNPIVTFRAMAPLLEGSFSAAYDWALDLRFYGLADHIPAEEILGWVGRRTQRAAIAVELCSAHEEALSPLARGLLLRFGPDSPVASALATHVESTPHAVESLAEFTAEQRRLARGWARDPDPRIRRWAEGVIESLDRSYEQHAAYEEHERRRWGT